MSSSGSKIDQKIRSGNQNQVHGLMDSFLTGWTSGGIRAERYGFAQQENPKLVQQLDFDF